MVSMMCDMMTIPKFTSDSGLPAGADPTIANLMTEWESWAMVPVKRLLRELDICGWPISTFEDAIRMAESRSTMGCMTHRIQRLRWIRRWFRFLRTTIPMPPEGEGGVSDQRG